MPRRRVKLGCRRALSTSAAAACRRVQQKLVSVNTLALKTGRLDEELLSYASRAVRTNSGRDAAHARRPVPAERLPDLQEAWGAASQWRPASSP